MGDFILVPPERYFQGRVIYDHLAKTAGQAVNAWLRGTLGNGCVTNNLIGKHRELIRQFGGEYSVISGHVEFHGEGLDPRYDYITCFRHPLDRAISWIFFVLENHNDQEIVELRTGVRNFLQTEGSQGVEFIHSNAVTNHLCSVHGFYSSDPNKRLEHALSVVDEYALWGIYEYLPEFIDDFAAFLLVPAPSRLERVNVTSRKPRVAEISSSLRAKIEELNTLDIALYDCLVARYGKTRRRWRRPSVTVSNWHPMPGKKPRRFCTPDFVLLSCRQEGGRNVNQRTILTFTIEFSLAHPVEVLECSIHLHDATGAWAFGTNSTLCGAPIGPLAAGTHCVHLSIVTSLPEGQYDVGFAFTEKLLEGQRVLAWIDKLAYFQINLDRHPPCVGYVSLPAVIGHRNTGDQIIRLPHSAKGRMQFIKPLHQPVASEQWKQIVELKNESNYDWISVLLNPLYLSYHWIGVDGEMVVVEGMRTALPHGQLLAGASIRLEMMVKAPDMPGMYRLQAQPVQEMHAWFDKLGFLPADIQVEIVSPITPRCYKADDYRLRSNVGLLVNGCWTSDDREGFLLFGPYTPLAAGRWRINWRGEFDPSSSGTILADVAYNVGTLVLGAVTLTQKCSSITLEVDVPENVMDAEFRLWLDSAACVRFDAVEVVSCEEKAEQLWLNHALKVVQPRVGKSQRMRRNLLRRQRKPGKMRI